jgi:hypothetical protein
MAKVFTNILLVDTPSNNVDERREWSGPTWLTESFWFATAFLVFIGAAAISRWAWPSRSYLSLFVTLLALGGWATVAHKLKVLDRSQSPVGWRGWMLRFLTNFLFFSSFMFACDVLWTPRPLVFSIIGACGTGFLFALFTASSRT